MFCILNTFTYPNLFKTAQPATPTYKLCQCLGTALQQCITAYGLRKSKDQTEPSISQKSCSITKIIPNEQKSQKREIQTSGTVIIQKKNDQQSKELKIKKSEEIIESAQNINRKSEFYAKRRIIRKVKKNRQSEEEKKLEKPIKSANNVKIDFTNFTAILPPLKKLSSRQILQKIEELKKRQVKQWKIEDPLAERRKRFLKHLQ